MHGTMCIHQVPAAPYAHEYAFPHGGGGVAILLGNERHGLSPEMISLCDGVVSYVKEKKSPSSTPRQCQVKLRAASSLGQLRPMGRDALAGRPYTGLVFHAGLAAQAEHVDLRRR